LDFLLRPESLVFGEDWSCSSVVADRQSHCNRVRESRQVDTVCFPTNSERAIPEGPNLKLTTYTRNGSLEIPSALLGCNERALWYRYGKCAKL